MSICTNCGAEVTSKFCTNCGTKINVVQDTEPSSQDIPTLQEAPSNVENTIAVSTKKRFVLILLYLFTGVIGGHRFYAGRPLSAVAILLMFVGFSSCGIYDSLVLLIIPWACWLVVDFFLVILGRLKDGSGARI